MAVSFITRASIQRLSISNGQIAVGIKPTDVGNWNHIRIGMVCAFTVYNIYYNPPPVFIGLCSGATNKYFSPTTDHAVGFITNENTTNWGAHILTTSHRIEIPHAECRFVKKENSVKTTFGTILGAGTVNENIFMLGTQTSNASEYTGYAGIILDLKKNNGNLDAQISYNGYNNVGVSKQEFELTITNPVVPSVYFDRYRTGVITNFNETAYGNLDNINIGWHSEEFNLEIVDIAYSVFS